MKETLLVICVYSASLFAQTSTTLPHAPVVVGTYEFKNLTGALPTTTLFTPPEKGIYRISTFLSVVTAPPLPSNGGSNGVLVPEVRATTDGGIEVQHYFLGGPDQNDLFILPVIITYLNFTGTVMLHTAGKQPLKYEIQASGVLPGALYNAYVVVEKL